MWWGGGGGGDLPLSAKRNPPSFVFANKDRDEQEACDGDPERDEEKLGLDPTVTGIATVSVYRASLLAFLRTLIEGSLSFIDPCKWTGWNTFLWAISAWTFFDAMQCGF